MIVAVVHDAQQVLRDAGRIDERRAPAILEKEDVTVARLRVLRVAAHVRAVDGWRTPAARGRIGELRTVKA